MTLKTIVLALALTQPVLHTTALADALTPPREVSAIQADLMGTWQQQGWVYPEGLGHTGLLRTVAFGTDNATMVTLMGIPPVNALSTQSVTGAWKAERIDTKTIKVTLDQGGGHGTEWTLIITGPDSFTLVDSEMAYYGPATFNRVGARITPITP